jgi:hypothetical protein
VSIALYCSDVRIIASIIKKLKIYGDKIEQKKMLKRVGKG